jgi:hypothetical protein
MTAVVRELQSPGFPEGLLPAGSVAKQAIYISSRINSLSTERQRRCGLSGLGHERTQKQPWYDALSYASGRRLKPNRLGRELADLYEAKRELRGRVERAYRRAMLRPRAKPSALSAPPRHGASRQ